MTLPEIASMDDWMAARQELRLKEKAATRARDELNTERRSLPMVEITKAYELEGPEGTVSLLDLFEGRRQLILYHFMFDPSWDAGCSSCTAGTDELSPGLLDHLHTRDTSYAMVSRASLEKLEKYKAERGWDVPWYSSFGSDFNYDFHATLDPSVAPVEFNGMDQAAMEAQGWDFGEMPSSEQPVRSCFLRVDDRIFLTYQLMARGLESTGGSYYFLDLTALGRQEDWEEPKGRTDAARGNRPDFAS